MHERSRILVPGRVRAAALAAAVIAMLWAPPADAKAKSRKKVPSPASMLTLVERAFHIAARADVNARKALLAQTPSPGPATSIAAGAVTADAILDGVVGTTKLAD